MEVVINSNQQSLVVFGVEPPSSPPAVLIDVPLFPSGATSIAGFYNSDRTLPAESIPFSGFVGEIRTAAEDGATLRGGSPPELFSFDSFPNFSGGVFVG